MKKALLFIVTLLFTLVLIACDGGNTEKKIVSIELDNTTVPTEITAYDFDLTTIKLLAKYSDNSTEQISLSKEFFDSENLAKFNTVGNQTIAFLYNSSAYIFSVNVVKGDPSLYMIDSIDVIITTENNKYNVSAKTQKNIDIYAEVSNTDVLTAVLTIVVSPEFTFSSEFKLNCTLDGKALDTTNMEIKNSKVTLSFDDVLWSPLA